MLQPGHIKFDITPDSNVNYTENILYDPSLVSSIVCGFDDPMPIEINGTPYVYRAYDLDLNEHRLVHDGVLHRLLGKVTAG
jgi:hypothetical protein